MQIPADMWQAAGRGALKAKGVPRLKALTDLTKGNGRIQNRKSSQLAYFWPPCLHLSLLYVKFLNRCSLESRVVRLPQPCAPQGLHV
jgi:hypothetical protein